LNCFDADFTILIKIYETEPRLKILKGSGDFISVYNIRMRSNFGNMALHKPSLAQRASFEYYMVSAFLNKY